MTYCAAQGAVWAYLELIGEWGGVARGTVATGLAVSMVVAFAGPTTAAFVGARFGRALPLLASLCLTLVALYLLSSSLNSVRFISAASLFNFAWNLSTPYQYASIAASDQSGRVIGLAASASLAGLAIGPLMAALSLDSTHFVNILWWSAALCVLSYVAFVPAWASVTTERMVG
jgi:hypothetical protein